MDGSELPEDKYGESRERSDDGKLGTGDLTNSL
jgi:hypothetical protein